MNRRGFLGAAFAALAALVLPKPKYVKAVDWASYVPGDIQVYQMQTESMWTAEGIETPGWMLALKIISPEREAYTRGIVKGIRSSQALLEFYAGGRLFCFDLPRDEAQQLVPVFDVLPKYCEPGVPWGEPGVNSHLRWLEYKVAANAPLNRLVRRFGAQLAHFIMEGPFATGGDFIKEWMRTDLGALIVDQARHCLGESPRRHPYILRDLPLPSVQVFQESIIHPETPYRLPTPEEAVAEYRKLCAHVYWEKFGVSGFG